MAAAAAPFAAALLSGGRLVASSPRHDIAAQFAAWRSFGFRELASGRPPLWNPHVFSGTPFLGNFESALLYPPNWLHLILPLGPALNAVMILHVFLAGAFAFLWARRRGLGRPGALLTGLAFMLSGPVVLRVYAGHLPLLCALAWAPALLLCLDGWAEERRARWLLLGAAAWALQALAGNPQIVYYTTLGAGLYAGLLLPRGRRGGGLRGLLAMGAGGAALSAVQLLPGLAAASESIRAGGLAFPDAAAFSLPPENLLTLVRPWVFGGLADYAGRGYVWESCLFLGATACALALYGGLAERAVRKLLLLAGIILVLALGDNTPLFGWLYDFLPGMSWFRGTGKLSFLAALFIALAAGLGLERLGRSSRRLAAAALALCALELLFFAWTCRSSFALSLSYPQEWAEELRSAPEDARVWHDPREFPNVAMIMGPPEIWGYGSFVLKRYARFLAAADGLHPDQAASSLPFRGFSPALRLLRLSRAFRMGAPPVAIERPLPRLLLVGSWRVAGGPDEALGAVLVPDFDPRAEAILERHPGIAPGPGSAGGSAELLGSGSDFLDIEATVEGPSLLVVTDSYSRGWRARPLSPGPQASYEVLPADYVLRGIPLLAGRHRLRLEYVPISWRIGLLVSTAACLLWAAVWVGLRFNRLDMDKARKRS